MGTASSTSVAETTSPVQTFAAIAGTVLIATPALAYVMGWRQASAYYADLGAPWFVSMLTPSQLLQSSGWIAPAICFVAMTTLQIYSNISPSERVLQWINFGMAVAVILAGAADVYATTDHANISKLLIHFVGACTFAACAGLAFAEMTYRVTLSKTWSWSHTFLMYMVLIWGVWTAPQRLGSDRAQSDLSVLSHLPRVYLPDQNQSETFALVDTAGENALLLNRTANSRTHTFKLVKVFEIQSIIPPQRELR